MMLDVTSVIIGAIIGAIATKSVDKLWAKTEKFIDDQRKPKLPYVGLVGGISKKRKRGNEK